MNAQYHDGLDSQYIEYFILIHRFDFILKEIILSEHLSKSHTFGAPHTDPQFTRIRIGISVSLFYYDVLIIII